MKDLDNQPQLFGHPIGLYVLFFTEMWERFSYYGMRAILILYITTKTMDANPGMGWSNGDALKLYGLYTMLVYVASIPGGLLADKVFGQKKAVLYGGLILVAGHCVLAITQDWAFYTGLGLIIAGVGLLKPNISTMVGGLYKQGDERRDKGFTIFYIGINIGAFLSSLIVGYVGQKIGWHYGFGLAGIGMLTGLIFFWSGIKKNVFGDKGMPPNQEVYEKKTLGIAQKTFIPIVATLCVPLIAFILASYKSITTEDTFLIGEKNLVGLIFLGIGISIAVY